MSIGPSSKAQKEASITSMKVVAGSMFHSFKKNPSGILFYFGMALLLVGLPLNVYFSLTFYLVLGTLGLITLCNWALEQRTVDNKKSHAK